jgi:hypothetical protein
MRGNNDAAVDATRKVLEDLACLNVKIGEHLAESSAKMLSTGDFLTGVENSSKEELMDGLYESWSVDAVHTVRRMLIRKLPSACLRRLTGSYRKAT